MAQLKQNHAIYLASTSRVRAELLQRAGLRFQVIPSPCNEDEVKETIRHLPPEDQAIALARAKAEAVPVFALPEGADSLIIAADQICESGKRIYSKPGNRENAIRQLQELSGKKHHLHSAISLFQGEQCLWLHVSTATLTMRKLTAEEIDAYVSLDEPYQSCGGYRIEGYGRHLFSDIKGDHDTIMGLPLVPMLTTLHQRKLIELVP